MLEGVIGRNNLSDGRKKYGIKLELLILTAKICAMLMVAVHIEAREEYKH
jgi:hypothetical protein